MYKSQISPNLSHKTDLKSAICQIKFVLLTNHKKYSQSLEQIDAYS